MKLKNWMIAKAIVCVLFGVGFVLLPNTLMSLYALKLGDGGVMMAQLLGASFILLSMLLWLNRDAAGSATQRSFALAMLVGDLIGFAVSLMAQLSGAVGALGWLTVVIYLVMALGFGYFVFAKNA